MLLLRLSLRTGDGDVEAAIDVLVQHGFVFVMRAYYNTTNAFDVLHYELDLDIYFHADGTFVTTSAHCDKRPSSHSSM